MTAKTLIELAASQGVELYVEQGKLKYLAPAGAFTAALKEQVGAHREAVIAWLTAAGGRGAGAALAEGGAPLSFAQQRLWFVDALDGVSLQYNMPLLLRLDGELDRAALAAAIGDVVARHQVLRTCYRAQGGEARQVVLPAAPFALPEVDLADLSPAAREAALERAVQSEYERPFDLGLDPMLRGTCFVLAPQAHALLLCFHHIACDGWSMGIFLGELDACYRARHTGAAPALPPLPMQYQAFARWQQDWLATGGLSEALDYWRERLADLPALHGLPTDRPRPARQGNAGADLEQRLPQPLLQALRGRAQRGQTSMFILLHTAFALLLARFGGERDIVVGTPVAGRQRSELEPLIGLFATPLVLRTDVDLGLDFDALLERNRRAVLADMERQDLPFERLVEALAPQRDAGAHPLFQILFSLQKSGSAPLTLGDLAVRQQAHLGGIVKCDLELAISERDDGLVLNWSYQTDLFEAATIRQLGLSFEALLDGLLESPDQAVGALPLIGAAREARLRGPELAAPPLLPVHAAFAAHAARRPDAPAASCAGRSLGYGALNERANALAHALMARGCGPGSVIACIPADGLSQVVALLAVAKAGGTCLPLDPELPAARVTALLEDAGAALLLHDGASPAQWPALGLDDFDPAAWPDHDPALEVAPDQPAYLVYTSGSSGMPKGVLVRHGELAGSSAARRQFYGEVGPALLLTASPGFDIFIGGLYWALSSGGSVEVIRYRPENVDQVIACANAGRVDALMMTPSMYDALLAGGARPRVRSVVLGGERLDAGLCARHAAAAPDAELVNEYGPSETTVWCTAWRCTEPPLGAPPVGLPVAGYELLVLDDALRLLPAGAVGELCIGGVGVAAGYLRRPELTAAAFVDLPWYGGRLYRTGDRGRVGADGQLHFVGRRDEQVKLRGHRIELGEIEHQLRALPGVRDAAVVVGPHEVLAAYVVLESGSLDQCRQRLGERLPASMMPVAWCSLAALPRTANGKLDRRALPAPDAPSAAPIAPSGGLDALLAMLWSEVLGRPPAHAQHDFFAAGGHSLLAVQLLARVRQALSVELSLRAFFAQSTPAGLAALVEAARGAPCLPAPQPQERYGHLPASYAQQRLWFIDRLEGGSRHYLMPGVLALDGALTREIVAAAVADLVGRHEVLRSSFYEHEGQVCLRVDGSGELPLAWLDLRGLDQEALDQRLQEHQRDNLARELDLAGPWLWRMQLLTVDDDRHLLLYCLHHSIADGWSLQLLERELRDGIAARSAGRAARLPPLPLQYADYALWQRRNLASDGGAARALLDYWRTRLHGLPEVHGLPLDRPRPPRQTFNGRQYVRQLGARVAQALTQAASAHGSTAFVCLQTAFAVLLSRYGQSRDIVMGTTVAGRSHQELEGLLGLFVNTLVLRTDVATDLSFAALLAQNQARVLEAFDHQQLPFDLLVEQLQPARKLGHSPLFQILFAYQRLAQPMAPLADEGRHGPGANKFDLELSVTQFDDGLLLGWNYNNDLFNDATVARLCDSLLVLLEAALVDPACVVGRLPLLDQRHLALLGDHGTATAAGYDTALCVHQLVERWAQRTPAAPALVHGERVLDYAQLNARANRLAHELIAAGVGPDCLIGLCLPRGAELIVALLAIQKAGGAYVPVDPGYPAERVAYLLEDSAMTLLLTTTALAEALRPACPVWRLDDEALRERLERAPVHDPDALAMGLSPRHLALVVYTSGSTGRPKGVMLEHDGLINYFQTQCEILAITAASRMLQYSSISFVASVYEYGAAFFAGAALYVPDDEEVADPVRLAALIARHGLSHVRLPPSLLPLLDPAQLACVRHLKVTGEACPMPLIAKWSAGRVLYNSYGATECSVGVATHAYAGTPWLPVGRPLANKLCYVVDADVQLLPLGAIGELLVGGVGLARGYLGRPDLSDRQFIDNPFGPGKVYRTGDLVRWLDDGTLLFCGRADSQLKVRGYRVEPGEVENRLLEDPAVAEAVVLGWPDAASGQRLVAYVVPDAVPDDRAAAILGYRRHLARLLPDYMVPSAFVLLDAMPLTPNGKIDKSALREPDAGDLPQLAYRAPRDERETVLCRLWAELLKVERVGIEDNFFSLGGDSILSIQLVARARQQGLHFSVRQLFEHQTVAALAVVATQAQARLCRQEAVQGEQVLLPAQAALLETDPEHLDHFNQAMLLATPAGFDLAQLQLVVQALYARHDALRLCFEVGADGPRARYLDEGATLAAQAVAALVLDGCADEALAATIEHHCEVAQRSLRPREGQLLRAVLFRRGDGPGRLLLVLHHLVVDGVTWRALLADLERAYEQVRQGRSVVPAPKTSALQDWGLALRERASGPAMERERTWWLERLTLPRAQLPGSTGPATMADVESVGFTLGEAVTQALLGEAHAAYRTRGHELLLAALLLALPRESGGAVTVMMEGHGRDPLFDSLDMGETAGWFTALYPLVLQLPAGGDLAELIKAVKEQCRQVPDGGLGYGLLTGLRRDPDLRALAAARPPQLVFNYLGQMDGGDGGGDDASTRFAPVGEPSGTPIDPARALDHPLNFNGMVVGRRLGFTLGYARQFAPRADMERLCRDFAAALETVATWCCAVNLGVPAGPPASAGAIDGADGEVFLV